jgi:hypothetical protein
MAKKTFGVNISQNRCEKVHILPWIPVGQDGLFALPPISFMQGTHRSGVKASSAEQDSAATVKGCCSAKATLASRSHGNNHNDRESGHGAGYLFHGGDNSDAAA